MKNIIYALFHIKEVDEKLNITYKFGLSVPDSGHIIIQNPKAQPKMPLWSHNGHKAERLKSTSS